MLAHLDRRTQSSFDIYFSHTDNISSGRGPLMVEECVFGSEKASKGTTSNQPSQFPDWSATYMGLCHDFGGDESI
jgi:hypothetical protein